MFILQLSLSKSYIYLTATFFSQLSFRYVYLTPMVIWKLCLSMSFICDSYIYLTALSTDSLVYLIACVSSCVSSWVVSYVNLTSMCRFKRFISKLCLSIIALSIWHIWLSENFIDWVSIPIWQLCLYDIFSNKL